MIRIVLLGLITAFGSNVYAQGALDGFVDSPGSKSFALSLSREKADIYFLGTGKLTAPNKVKSISLYYKHQFNKWIGVAVNLPLVDYVPQDGNVYLKFSKAFKINSDLSINGVLGVGTSHPLSNYDTSGGDAIGQQAKAVNFRAITQITYKNRWFLNGRIGHDAVQSPTPSSNVYSVKLGFYKDKWYADVWFEELSADGGKDYRGVGDLAPSSFKELGVSHSKIGGVVYHQTKDKLGVFLGGARTIDGRNTRRNNRISVGIVVKI